MTTQTTAPHARDLALDAFDDTTLDNGRTARGWEVEARRLEQEARDSRERSAESFDRCDTDGFLSQWANDSMGRLYAARAELARDHGYMTHRALFDLDGRVISTREVETRYGLAWVVDDEQWLAAGGRKWINESEARNDDRRIAANVRKGVQVGHVRVAGTAQNRGESITSVSARYIPDTDALEAGDYTVITECVRYHLDGA